MQRFYGIDLDHAMRGEHTPNHIAELVRFVPQDSALVRAIDDDAMWTLDRSLLAALLNSLNLMIWGMSDKSKRGAKPEMVGSSRMRNNGRALDAQAMPIDELMAVLSLERSVTSG